ncbi:MAG: biopolymer transporter ExbD [Pedosphaera sp.]|nr:biopolymer transporter ExbD [Pedosphaera sp.]
MHFNSPLPRKKARIEIIPLIDVMFFLLAAFMMVSLTLQKAQTIKMNLPTAVAAQKDFKPEIFNIGVDKLGDLYVGKERILLADMRGMLTNRLAGNTNLAVYITGDKLATHGRVIEVLDLVHRSGVQKVSFAIEPVNE